MTDKEREILVLRFGLNHQEPMTLDAIGKRWHCTREWIRQRESSAMRKLVFSKQADELLTLATYPEKAKEYLTQLQKRYGNPKNRNKSINKLRETEEENMPKPVM